MGFSERDCDVGEMESKVSFNGTFLEARGQKVEEETKM